MACYGRNRIQRGRAPEIRASQSSIEPSLVKINQHAVNLPTKLTENLCYQMIETSLCNVSARLTAVARHTIMHQSQLRQNRVVIPTVVRSTKWRNLDIDD